MRSSLRTWPTKPEGAVSQHIGEHRRRQIAGERLENRPPTAAGHVDSAKSSCENGLAHRLACATPGKEPTTWSAELARSALIGQRRHERAHRLWQRSWALYKADCHLVADSADRVGAQGDDASNPLSKAEHQEPRDPVDEIELLVVAQRDELDPALLLHHVTSTRSVARET